ncbi:2-oxoadipate dioxygenase/decarboxylase [Kineosporia babensis]|uniref:2-oxoadipate dioxygenase/decarboxylase n=1 Tax=Kineosporia babensis TaxID=499548 RepID=A0A9X1STI5_9ACTN|nr:VOC family protein [Kineosporia babensis]MCD5311862.1 VOC family protein [Kineosporia babensis]
MPDSLVPQWQLRAQFALRLAAMYGTEVPAYTTLVEVSRAVNEDVAAARGDQARRLGSIERVSAERHGAIRVGSRRELAQVARVFAAFGMHPVGFYDLRDASKSSVPVVSTAFRPVEAGELARNPFRVFTSMLVTEDRRFFDAETQGRLEQFIAARRLFGPRLLELADRAADLGELSAAEAAELLELATGAFALSAEPVDQDWYQHLERISSVAADIGGVASTHINHLTPRVLDIDDLYRRMQAHGITMIDEIQGPPAWDGPDVLLRQTSFKALAEDRVFRRADGTIQRGQLKVRFGEVEQRGIALTVAGRELYDRMVAQVDEVRGDRVRTEVARQVWQEHLPNTELELAAQDLGFFTFRPGPARPRSESVPELIRQGALIPEPIVYEDFLPRSAAGIFQSNLTDDGTRDDEQAGAEYDLQRLSEVIGREIHDPNDLYARERNASLAQALQRL